MLGGVSKVCFGGGHTARLVRSPAWTGVLGEGAGWQREPTPFHGGTSAFQLWCVCRRQLAEPLAQPCAGWLRPPRGGVGARKGTGGAGSKLGGGGLLGVGGGEEADQFRTRRAAGRFTGTPMASCALAQVLANSGQFVALNGKTTLGFAAAEVSEEGVGRGSFVVFVLTFTFQG